ncbi:hypothetical protein [Kozakia baliensis]|uniref:Uncharacterized protein n=1 Tax=Kozakia baliensis TaxID=153496 RepID=A0A1D8UQJ8_9PROT|nr:hypothetical protein [Kozakia baliensis]AOX15922.1 hypothetical protein A0U89_00885 [Kozakia baliensis]GBR27522.1 hypothetical protein AA0488_1163 [Kozakia baliensis NRIC 0488]GEL64191.1 hypothetical protein KBA01_14770 [Kozakia baliensis]
MDYGSETTENDKRETPKTRVTEGGPEGPQPSMWKVIRASLDDALALLRSEWSWVLALFAISLALSGLSAVTAQSANGGRSGLPFLLSALSQLLCLPFTLRFCARLLGIESPTSLSSQIWPRIIGWSIFCIVLTQIGHAGALPSPLPSPVTGIMFVGSIYFRTRLLALYPALLSWPEWPGVDRIWNPSGRFVLPLIGCGIAIYLPISIGVLLILIGVSGVSPFHQNAAAANAQFYAAIRHLAPYLAVVQAVLQTALTVFSAALMVRIFRLIARRG